MPRAEVRGMTRFTRMMSSPYSTVCGSRPDASGSSAPTASWPTTSRAVNCRRDIRRRPSAMRETKGWSRAESAPATLSSSPIWALDSPRARR